MPNEWTDPESRQDFMFDFRPTAEQLRDEAISRVIFNSGKWMPVALNEVNLLPDDFVGMGEDIRRFVADRIGNPRDEHAWGALVMLAAKRRLIEPIHEFRKPRDPKSHASKKQAWRKGWGGVKRNA